MSTKLTIMVILMTKGIHHFVFKDFFKPKIYEFTSLLEFTYLPILW